MRCTYLSEYDKIACSAVYGYPDEAAYAQAVSSIGDFQVTFSSAFFFIIIIIVIIFFKYHYILLVLRNADFFNITLSDNCFL